MSDTFLPLRFILTAGMSHDVRQAPALIAGYTFECVIADTVSYDSDPLRAKIVAQGVTAVIRLGTIALKSVLTIQFCTNFATSLNVFFIA